MHSLGLSRAKTNQATRLKQLESDKDAHSAHTSSAFRYLLSSSIKTEQSAPKQKQPIPGLQFAEVMYADDMRIFGCAFSKLISSYMRHK